MAAGIVFMWICQDTTGHSKLGNGVKGLAKTVNFSYEWFFNQLQQQGH